MSISITRSGLLKLLSTSCLALAAGAAFSATDIRINAGGGQYKDSAGNTWSADFGFNGGVVANDSTLSILKTVDDTIYQSRRRHTSSQGDLSYAIPVSNGKYNVRLHFSENYEGTFKVGARVFSITAEGKKDPTSVDVFKEAGAGYTAMIRTFPVEVSDGKLNISFTDQTSTSFISGIEVLSVATPATEKVIYRVNSGGGKVTDSNGTVWSADTYFLNGLTSVAPASINIIGTAEDDIYLSRRRHTASENDLEYAFPVDNGDYSVRLHFAENYEGTFGFGKRVFDIYAENKLRKDNFDVYAKAGAGYTALKETISGITVTDGKLNIRFKDEVSTAFISAIEVISNSAEVTTPRLEALFRVNAGGNSFKDGAGNLWSADGYFSSGMVSTDGSLEIANTKDDTIYQSRRRNASGLASFVYSFPTGNGEYAVNLHFSENYLGTAVKGARVFDVFSEGKRIVNALDVYAQTGKEQTALVKNIPSITVTDGKLTLRFEDIESTAFVSGIEVFKVSGSDGSAGSGSGDSSETIPLKITTQPSNQVVNPTLNVTMSVVAQGPGTLSYQWFFNGNKINGATNATLRLTSVSSSNAGNYFCIVSSAGQSVKSNVAQLVVSGTAPAVSKNIRVTWVAPTKRADGSALAAGDIASYEVFYGLNSSSSLKQIGTVSPDQLKFEYKDVEKGTHYFAIKTVDKNGVRSKLSSTTAVVHD